MKRLLILSMIAGFLFAGNTTIGMSVNNDQFYIGDRIWIDLKITAPEKQMLILPHAEEWISDLQVLDVSTRQKIKKQVQFIDMRIEAVAFDTGFVHIPPLPLVVTDSTGFGEPDTLYSPEKYIYIASILDSTASPTALKPPLPLALMTWWELLIAIMLVLASMTLLILGIRHRKGKQTMTEDVWESPREKALHYLKELEEKQYPQKKQWKKFYLELTYVTRDYFEHIYYLHLQELTTSELIPVLNEAVPAEFSDRLVEFFHFADLVKFARSDAREEQCRKHFELIESIIQKVPQEMSNEISAGPGT